MKREEITKLSQVIKKLVQNEVNLAVKDIGKVMSQVIKEQVKKELDKQRIILKEQDIISNKRNAGQQLRDDFNKKMNYGYTLSQTVGDANSNGINIRNYSPPPMQEQPIVKTGNKVLDGIFNDVAAEMPEDFGSEFGMMTPMASLNEMNLNMNSMGGRQPQPYYNQPPQQQPYYNQQPQMPVQQQQPINFELPTQDTEGGMLHINNVSSDVINKLVKNYRPVINQLEKKKPSPGQMLNYKDVGSVSMDNYGNS